MASKHTLQSFHEAFGESAVAGLREVFREKACLSTAIW